MNFTDASSSCSGDEQVCIDSRPDLFPLSFSSSLFSLLFFSFLPLPSPSFFSHSHLLSLSPSLTFTFTFSHLHLLSPSPSLTFTFTFTLSFLHSLLLTLSPFSLPLLFPCTHASLFCLTPLFSGNFRCFLKDVSSGFKYVTYGVV